MPTLADPRANYVPTLAPIMPYVHAGQALARASAWPPELRPPLAAAIPVSLAAVTRVPTQAAAPRPPPVCRPRLFPRAVTSWPLSPPTRSSVLGFSPSWRGALFVPSV